MSNKYSHKPKYNFLKQAFVMKEESYCRHLVQKPVLSPSYDNSGSDTGTDSGQCRAHCFSIVSDSNGAGNSSIHFPEEKVHVRIM